MRMENVALTLDENLTSIEVMYQEGSKEYTFVCTKELANSISVGDLVLARDSYGVKVVQVLEVHEEVTIDLEAKWSYRWAFQKVETDIVDALEKRNKFLASELNKKKKQGVKKQALQALGFNDAQEFQRLLEIADKLEK